MNILCNFEVMSYPSFEAFKKSGSFGKNVLLYTDDNGWIFFNKNYEKVICLGEGKDLLGGKVKFGKKDFTIEPYLKYKQQTGKVSEDRKNEILDIISKCLQREQISIPQIPNEELEILTSYLSIVHPIEYHLKFNTSFHYLSEGFFNAAKILDEKERRLWKKVEEEGEGEILLLTQTVNFLYAFSIECCLKAVLHFHENKNANEFVKVSNTHNINELYQKVTSKLKDEFPDLVKFKNQKRLFDKLTMLIKDGKYPYSNNPRKDVMEKSEIMRNKKVEQKDKLYYKDALNLRENDKKLICELFCILYNVKNKLWQQMSNKYANQTTTN